jgi:hypothetical protein
MLLNSFFLGFNHKTKCPLDKSSNILFIINKPYDAFTILDGILIESDIIKSLKKARFIDIDINKEMNSGEEEEEEQEEEKEENINTPIDKENTLMITSDEQIEEVKNVK